MSHSPLHGGETNISEIVDNDDCYNNNYKNIINWNNNTIIEEKRARLGPWYCSTLMQMNSVVHGMSYPSTRLIWMYVAVMRLQMGIPLKVGESRKGWAGKRRMRRRICRA
jgi:hypothetical protein